MTFWSKFWIRFIVDILVSFTVSGRQRTATRMLDEPCFISSMKAWVYCRLTGGFVVMVKYLQFWGVLEMDGF